MKALLAILYASTSEGVTVYCMATALKDHTLGLVAVAATVLFLVIRIVHHRDPEPLTAALGSRS